MTKLPLIALALAFFAVPAEAQPTPGAAPGVRAGCVPLCQDAIPDEQRVRQCLVRNMRRLNPTCRSAFHRRRGPLTYARDLSVYGGAPIFFSIDD